MRKFKITFSKWEQPNEMKFTIIRADDQELALTRFFKRYNINTTYIFDIIEQMF